MTDVDDVAVEGEGLEPPVAGARMVVVNPVEGKGYPPEVRREAKRLYEDGWGLKRIQAHMNIGSIQTVRKWARDKGWQRNPNNAVERARTLEMKRASSANRAAMEMLAFIERMQRLLKKIEAKVDEQIPEAMDLEVVVRIIEKSTASLGRLAPYLEQSKKDESKNVNQGTQNFTVVNYGEKKKGAEDEDVVDAGVVRLPPKEMRSE